MRILSFDKIKFDKSFSIAFCAAFILSVIYGIVLCKTLNFNDYFLVYAKKYTKFVFEFNTFAIVLPYMFRELACSYAAFALSRSQKSKIFVVCIVAVRAVTSALYCALIFVRLGFEGIACAVIVYIPSSLFAVATYYFIAHCRCVINKKYWLFCPAACVVAGCVLLIVLLNVVFRLFIVII